jgi:glycosyltransferase involved in cell wall biosynthesis
VGKGANRRNRKRNQKKVIKNTAKIQSPEIVALPRIIGGNFDKFANDIAQYQSIIDSVCKKDREIRILFSTEASYLHTGFSTYLREVFKRLHSTGKYELAELGSYGECSEKHEKARQIPWKYYHNLPTNTMEAQQYGMIEGQVINQGYQENQFGKWKFNHVVADFKPDIVITNRDHWMDHWIKQSAFRGNFVWIWMPTVDGYPQRWQWLRDYSTVDHVLAYSWFGKKVLETQSTSKLAKMQQIKELKVQNVCQPGVDLNIFRPLNKNEIKKIFGIPEHLKFVGTVMRNQPRKLFPRILESFKEFKKHYPKESQNVLLLLHTSMPDVGWDINDLIYQNGLENHVVYSYLCDSCQNIGISTFIGSPGECPTCKKVTFHTPNTQRGFKDEHLAMIFNLMEVYIQGSIAEGDGMPVNEAKACGIPCLVSDYSALYEKARNGGALALASDTLYTEAETGQWRDLFCRKDLAKKLGMLIGSEARRIHLGRQARECAEKFYGWDLCAKKWESLIDSIDLKDRSKTWNAPIALKEPCAYGPPSDLSDVEFVKWCYINILCRQGVDNDGMHYWTRQLAQGASRQEMEKHFRNIINKENEKKKILMSPDAKNTDPMERIKKVIEKAEGVCCD